MLGNKGISGANVIEREDFIPGLSDRIYSIFNGLAINAYYRVERQIK